MNHFFSRRAHKGAFTLLAILMTATAPAFAQGDTCLTAVPIAGTGLFPFDTTGASTSGLGCPRSHEMYWTWTPPQTGAYIIDTESPPGSLWLDASLGIYDDPACDLQNPINCAHYLISGLPLTIAQANAGQTYWIEIGLTAANPPLSNPTGTGLLSIELDPCGPLVIVDDNFEDNDSIANAAPIGFGTYPGLVASETDLDYYTITLPPHSALEVLVSSSSHQLVRRILTAQGSVLRTLWPGDPVSPMFFDPQSATPLELIVSVEYIDGILNQHECTEYDLDLIALPGDDRFSSYCRQSGTTSELLGTHEASPAGDQVHLSVSHTVNGPLGYFLAGPTALDPGNVIGSHMGLFDTAWLCLQGGFVRYNVIGTEFNSTGSAQGQYANLSGTGSGQTDRFTVPLDLPDPFGGVITGGTWHFQFWYRDTLGTSRTSHGLSVEF